MLVPGANLHQAQPDAASFLSGSQPHPGMTNHPSGLVFLSQGQLLLAVNHRRIFDAEDEEAFGSINLAKKLIVLPVVSVAHTGLAGLTHLPQSLSLAKAAFGDEPVHRLAFHNMETQMEPYALGLSVGSDTIFGPSHARQSAPKAAVLSDQFQVSQPRIWLLAGFGFVDQLMKHLSQELWVQNSLGF